VRWHRLNVVLHRDIGYLAFGLTIVYAVSGLAVNHRADWNPSVSTARVAMQIDPIVSTGREAIVSEALARLKLSEPPRSTFQPDPDTLRVFMPDATYSIDLPTGAVVAERNRQRPVLFEFNQLHLNTPKGIWTVIADLYAIALLVIAVTGLFVLKGRHGITRRGGWLTAAGVLGPGAYWLVHLYLE
jgi:hypothetical protein